MVKDTQNETISPKLGENTPAAKEITPREIVAEITGASMGYISEIVNGKKKTDALKAKLVLKVHTDVCEGVRELRDTLLEKYKEVTQLNEENTNNAA